MKQVSVEKIGREVVLSDELLKKALDPQTFVDIRTVQGGTSAIATSAVLDDLEETIHADLEYYDATITKLNIANKRLAEHVQAIINEGIE